MLLTSADVFSVTGVSQRCLDYWERLELIEASGSARSRGRKQSRGRQRLYTYEDVVRIRVIKGLRDAGLSLQRIQKAVSTLIDPKRALDDVLVTDGKQLQRIRADGKVEDLLRKRQLVFAVVSLGRMKRELKGKILRLEKKSSALGSSLRTIAAGNRRHGAAS